MKRKGIAIAALFATSVMLFAAGCKNNTNDPNNPNGPNGSGGSAGDTYVDYNPDKQPGGDQFDYPGNYAEPELTIDGKGDDPQWQAIAEPLLTYGKKVSDGNGGTVDAVSVKAYRGENALFLLFEVRDTELRTQGVTNDNAVTRGDSVEFYIDSKADGDRKPQSDDFQINLGIHGKTRIMQGAGENWGDWNGLIDYEVDLNGTLNEGAANTDTGYTVEVMVQYKDIMIEKDDTIGIAFGQVDKVREEDAVTGSETGPWNWYGWTYNGAAVDPQHPNTYIMLDKDGRLVSREEVNMPPADMAGTVTDAEGNPVVGATATVVVGGVEQTATTDGRGYFVFEDVDSDNSYTVSIAKDGYVSMTETYTRAELREANGSVVLKNIVLVSSENIAYTTVTGTVKNVTEGIVGGATVSIKGMPISATADANGAFTLSNVPANNGDVTIVVAKTGYSESETEISENVLVADGTTALGDVNLSLPAGETGAFGTLNLLAYNRAYITRTLTGVEISFTGEETFNGWLELFIDTKESSASRNATNVLYKLYADGEVEVENYGGNFKTDGIRWTVDHTNEGYTAKVLIPYTTLGIGALEVFGISLGQNNGQDLWNGWDRADMVGSNGIAYVAPEIPTDYIRVGANNKLYWANHNQTLVAFGGTVESDGVGLAGVTVKIGALTATTDAKGKWSLSAPCNGSVTIEYSKIGYVSKTTTVGTAELSGVYEWSESITLNEQKVTVSGTVTDQKDDPVADVEVTLTVGTQEFTTVTDAQGRYAFEDVTTYVDVKVAFEKDGYLPVLPSEIGRDSLASAANGEFVQNKKLTADSQIKTISVTGKVSGIDGALQGVTVSVEGRDISVQTAADGTFTFENFECIDGKFIVSFNGYLEETLVFLAESADDVSTYALPDIFLAREYAQIGGAFATKDAGFANFTPYITRGENEIMFRLAAENAFTGNVELFINTGLTSGLLNERHTGDYLFELFAEGNIKVTNYGNGTNTDSKTLSLDIATENGKTVLYFAVPYSFLNLARTDIFGVSFGQSSANGWDGWNYADSKGINGSAYVDPAITADYVRIGTDNRSFWNAVNAAVGDFDMTGHLFYLNLDRTFFSVSRDGEGITIDAIAFGDFSKDNGFNEMILVYFDTGATEDLSPWEGIDYLLKVASDGNVYGRAGNAWWKESAADVLGTAAIVNGNVNGLAYKKVTYKLSYSALGIGSSEVFGISFREASQEYASDHKLYDGNCAFNGVALGDTAMPSNCVRVKADGTCVVAGSNAAVTD